MVVVVVAARAVVRAVARGVVRAVARAAAAARARARGGMGGEGKIIDAFDAFIAVVFVVVRRSA